MTGVFLAGYGVGAVLGNGWTVALSARLGKKRTMVAALAVEISSGVAAFGTRNMWVFAFLLVIMGAAHSAFFLSRLGFFRQLVPNNIRGRALSLLGGESRVGSSVGPLIGGIVADRFGSATPFFLFALASGFVALCVVLFVPGDQPSQEVESLGVFGGPLAMLQQVQRHRRTFLSAGLFVVALKFARESRKFLFPLWGSLLGMSATAIGGLFTLTYFAEMLMVYPGGVLMDTYGRKHTAVPCLMMFGIGFFLLPLAVTVPSFFAVAVFIALGNGLGSGINMTLSADFAPSEDGVAFLAAWRTITDAGGVAGPAVVSACAALLGLGAAGILAGAVSFAGSACMIFLVRTVNVRPSLDGTP